MTLNYTLATLNAALTTTGGILLLVGWYFIKRGARQNHQRAMVAATVVQGLFLVSYLARIAIGGTTVYEGTGLARTIYLIILATHVLLAMVQLPFIVLTLWRAYKGEFALHRKVARVTLPMWLYVSFTGPIVYLMLHWK